MIVEDEPEVLTTIESMVHKLGHDAVTATNGPAALVLFEGKQPIDLLLTDVGMAKGMSGLDLSRALTAKQPGLPVIFMSGYSGSGTFPYGEADGREALLTKPFLRAELGAAIDVVLATVPAMAKPAI